MVADAADGHLSSYGNSLSLLISCPASISIRIHDAQGCQLVSNEAYSHQCRFQDVRGIDDA
jgi:hypothetical protein